MIESIKYLTDKWGRLFKSVGNIDENLHYLQTQLNTGINTINADINKAKDSTVVEPVAATVTTDLTGTNDVVFTAETKGAAGNALSVAYDILPEITVDDGSANDLFRISMPGYDRATTEALPKLTITQTNPDGELAVTKLDAAGITVTLPAVAGTPTEVKVTTLKTLLLDYNEKDNLFVDGVYEFEEIEAGETVPAVSESWMDSIEAIALSGTDIAITLETTSGTITTAVADIIALVAGDEDVAALIAATANASDDQAIDDVGEWDLAGGINGTVAEKGEMLFDGTALYVAIDDCTISESNWMKIALKTVAPTIVDLDADDYTVAAGDTIIIATNNNATPNGIILKEATGSSRILTISNEAAETLTINPDGVETIGGASDLDLAQGQTATIIDYAEGAWAII